MNYLKKSFAISALVLSGVLICSAGHAQSVNKDVPRDTKGTVVTKENVVFVKDKNAPIIAPKVKKSFRRYKLKTRIRPCSFGTVYTY